MVIFFLVFYIRIGRSPNAARKRTWSELGWWVQPLFPERPLQVCRGRHRPEKPDAAQQKPTPEQEAALDLFDGSCRQPGCIRQILLGQAEHLSDEFDLVRDEDGVST